LFWPNTRRREPGALPNKFPFPKRSILNLSTFDRD
jgi:hypothetical protein